ncbi:hypothetical protein QQY66_23325 [Streptomyces sp. DG2A-72]|uniref:hypothetical protein n=1 Tax=Streptomyces sp. DG2A-72 TaxID=3051386 RepID=UPI00265C1F6D|nr:hypothetical protein [Streptomyces sp. DG2A-72]MDO0934464.1 hypothetical protein [Streptomyces sp. DG2A-72]
MEILAGDWWASGSLWQFIITIIAGIAVGVLGAWATFRSNNPKHRINWWIKSNTPLISLPQFSTGRGPLTVNLGPDQLHQPRIVELVIANQGRRDITADMFHGGEPIRFDLGHEVKAILEVANIPAGSLPPDLATGRQVSLARPVSARGWLDVKPSLLRRGQLVTVTLLVDGDERKVKCERFPLINVTPVEGPPGVRKRAFTEAISIAALSVGSLRFMR